MKYAASKWLLQVREKSCQALVSEDRNYTYHDTRKAAVDALIEREEAAIAKLERQIGNARTKLRAFKRKETT